MQEKIQEIVLSHMLSSLKNSKAKATATRLITMIDIALVSKPLLIVGTSYQPYEDGHYIAVLNPDESIINKIIAGCSYGGRTLNEIVSGKCDFMLDLSIVVYKNTRITVANKYQSRSPKPPKFVVK